MMINGDAFKVYMKCTHKSSIFIYALSFDGFWQEKYITPNVTFWRSHDIVNTKNGIFLSWLLIFSYACNNSLFNVCVYSKPFYMYGFAYFITFCGKVEDSMEQHLTNPLSPYCERPTWAMSCFCFLQESGHMNIKKYAIQASFWSQT